MPCMNILFCLFLSTCVMQSVCVHTMNFVSAHKQIKLKAQYQAMKIVQTIIDATVMHNPIPNKISSANNNINLQLVGFA